MRILYSSFFFLLHLIDNDLLEISLPIQFDFRIRSVLTAVVAQSSSVATHFSFLSFFHYQIIDMDKQQIQISCFDVGISTQCADVIRPKCKGAIMSNKIYHMMKSRHFISNRTSDRKYLHSKHFV